LNSSPHIRRGRLKNGNPSGDFLAAPRCGACSRAGATCRQPAMANGRCRFHGGFSTGPRTAEGRARCARARRTHGGYSREIVELRRAARAHSRRVRALLALMPTRRGRRPAGHGVLPSKTASGIGAGSARPLSSTSSTTARSRMTDPRASAARPYAPSTSSAFSAAPRESSPPTAPAGHGVLPSFSRIGGLLRRMLGLPRVAPARPHPYVPGAPPTLGR